MLWCYDNAIAQDLESCISPDVKMSSHVRIADSSSAIGIIAQLQEDRIDLPLLCLMRDDSYEVDEARSNFTRLHKGVSAVFDPEVNDIYLEKALPIKLSYTLHVLTSNTIDMDEIIRELLFRYTSMYFLNVQIPYESKRNIRFGISIPPGTTIQRESGQAQFLESGTIFESTIPLVCEGAILISYTPKHMERIATEITSNIDVEEAIPNLK